MPSLSPGQGNAGPRNSKHPLRSCHETGKDLNCHIHPFLAKSKMAALVLGNNTFCPNLQVLVDFQENPKAAQEHMKNPMVMSKIQKLVHAGIVQMR